MLTKKTNFFKFQLMGLTILTSLPLIYAFILIQYSAITVPFWDHVELIYWLTSWYEGNLSFLDLFASHNHSRPFIYRLVMLSNAILTKWDIRSEYSYMFLAIYGTFSVHFFALRSLSKNFFSEKKFLAALLLISIILFSPVGHNNHWWSMMFQLNATSFFITFSFLLVFLKPTRLDIHLLSLASLWAASFTLTNGLFAILTVIITLLISCEKLFSLSKFSILWIVNFFLILTVYVPGLGDDSSGSNLPSIIDVWKFVLAYLGSPISGLIYFPFTSMFDIPTSINLNATVGLLLLVTFTTFCIHLYKNSLINKSTSLIFLSFSIFSIISAFITALGRANFDDIGVFNANASRYSIFAAYMIVGQIYYAVGIFFDSETDLENRKNNIISRNYVSRFLIKKAQHIKKLTFLVVSIFVILSFISYYKGIAIYKNAHNFNKEISQYYTWSDSIAEMNSIIHPDPVTLRFLKDKLQEFELGPYSNRSYYRSEMEIGDFQTIAFLSRNRKYSQKFISTRNRLKALRVTFVTPNKNEDQNLTNYVEWTLKRQDNQLTKISSGKIVASQINDWEAVRIKLPFLENSMGVSYILTLSSDASDTNCVGIALYELESQNVERVTVSGDPYLSSIDLSMNIELEYID